MQSEIQRLENLLFTKQNTINKLNMKVKLLQQQVQIVNQQVSSLKMRAYNNFSCKNDSDREMVQILEAKLASCSWQILELQKMNMKYEQNLIKLQSDFLCQGQQLGMKRFIIQNNVLIKDVNQFEQIQNFDNFKQLETLIKNKEQLIQENFKLKNQLRENENLLKKEMAYYVNELANLTDIMKNHKEIEKKKMEEFENIANDLKKENDQLRQHLGVKNQHLLLYYNSLKMISTDKLSDMNTIRNLRRQIIRKQKQFHRILLKIGEIEQIKIKFMEYNNSCSESLGEFNKLYDQLQSAKAQIGILKQKLKQKQQKGQKYQLLIQENNKKLYELLVNNQACHKLLYEARGQSHLFTDDIQQKITQFLKSLEKRRQNSMTWLDVTDLIAVNQKMRTCKFFYEDHKI